MKNYILPKKTITLWRIRSLILFLLLFGVVIFLPISPFFKVIFSSFSVVLFFFFIVLYIPKFLIGCQATIFNGSITVKHGIFIENTHILPFSKLIHTTKIQTPLSRLFSLSMIVLKSARFNVIIFELDDKSADDLINTITAEGLDD